MQDVIVKESKFKNMLKEVSFWTFLISIIGHFLFLRVHLRPIVKIDTIKPKEQRKIKISFQKRERENTSLLKKQIVTTEKSKNETKPKDSKFLSKNNQNFDRETVSKKVGFFKEAAKGIRTGVNKKSVSKKNTSKTKTKKIVKNTKKGVTKKRNLNLGDLAFGSKIKKPRKERMLPSKQSVLGLKKGKVGTAGLSQNNDFVEEVALGDVTNLNTVEYKYYGFYHRIKQKLEQHWGNSLRKKAEILYKQGRRVPASENRITSLIIKMDNLGNIIDIKIMSTSGVTELDDAAIESFKQAGPFPNPPKGMLKGGFAKIEWGFVVRG